MFQFRNRYFLLLDIILVPASIYMAYVLRLEALSFNIGFGNSLLIFVVLSTVMLVASFQYRGLYSRYWLYASIDDLLDLLGTSFFSIVGSTILTLTVIWLTPIGAVFPRSVPLISLLLVIAATVLPRFGLRVFDFYFRRGEMKRETAVLIIGAGSAGEKVVRELQHNPQAKMHPVAFVDDDQTKHGMKLHGVPIIGARQDIPRITKTYKIKKAIIAIPTAAGKEIREIVDICDEAGIKTKIMPSLHGLLDGSINVSQLRNVEIEDLLRRESVKTDISAVRNLLRGKRVLITGGGGSIGSELCRQIARCEPREIVMLGHGENSIFSIYHEIKSLDLPETVVLPVIADVRFPERIQKIFATHRPQIVFHAAAHKHVPLMEANPEEAITNNVLGTRNLLNAALDHDVQNFVMISTDKAVNPTSVMGASKRAAELLVHQASEKSGNPYVAVRFGNVLGSRGSVVLTFKEQIKRGGPVTVTHPEMRRFFMTIPEAVQLVLQAAVLGHGGEVFVLNMGDPIKIVDLARDLIELSGLEVGHDIDIVFTGIRPGEKLFEEMFIEGESYKPTQHDKIFIAENASTLIPDDIDELINELSYNAWEGSSEAVVQALQKTVPLYTPNRRSA